MQQGLRCTAAGELARSESHGPPLRPQAEIARRNAAASRREPGAICPKRAIGAAEIDQMNPVATNLDAGVGAADYAIALRVKANIAQSLTSQSSAPEPQATQSAGPLSYRTQQTGSAGPRRRCDQGDSVISLMVHVEVEVSYSRICKYLFTFFLKIDAAHEAPHRMATARQVLLGESRHSRGKF